MGSDFLPRFGLLQWVRFLTIGCFLACFGLVTAKADDAAVLIIRHGAQQNQRVDLPLLDSLPQHSFQTTTQWTEGAIVFSGPSLADVLGLANPRPAPDDAITLIAANSYEVDLDPNLLEEGVPIVATRINGLPFGVRQKGPFWVVFPYDRDVKYQSELVFASSIWHLSEIFIE